MPARLGQGTEPMMPGRTTAKRRAMRNAAALSFFLLAREVAAQSNTVIVVTASRLEALDTNAMRVPADVTVIDRERIENSRARNLPDLLRDHGNIIVRSVNGQGDASEIAMRGFGENSGQRVLIILDDQKLNRSDMGLQDWRQIALDDIEHIEILRGGQSALYGNHALSGVIRITTRKDDEPRTHLSAAAGSHGFQEYGVRHSGSLEDLRYAAGASYQRDDGYRDHSASWSYNASARLNHSLSQDDEITLRFSGGANKIEMPGPLTYRQFRETPRISSNAGDSYAQTDNGLVTALYEGARDWGSLQINSGVNLRNIDWRMNGLEGWNQQRGYSLSPKARYGDPEEASISGGLDLLFDTLDFTGENNLIVNRATLDRVTAGPFLMAQKRLFDSLILSAGVRYEMARTRAKNTQFNKADMQEFLDDPWGGPPIPNPNYPAQPDRDASFDGAFSKSGCAYETALLWEVSDALSLWCRYNRVYRYPALDESASYQGYPLANPLNTGLDPETGHNFEAGAKALFGPWRATATLFYLMMDNEIAYDDNKKMNANIGATDRCGADLSLAFEQETYGASALVQLVAAEFDGGNHDGNRIPLVPEAHGVLSLWIEPLHRFRLTGTYAWTASSYQGGDFGNQLRSMDSYGLVGLRANLKIRETLGLFAKAENLLDEHYAASAYSGGWYPGSGRALYAGMTLEF